MKKPKTQSHPVTETKPEVTELKRMLAATHQELAAARQKIEELENAKTSLQRKLMLLAKKYVSARHFAYHDELTGLPNRSLLVDRLKQALVQADRQNKKVALLFIDLDKFKDINDKLGHTVGDMLLQQVAERLTSCIRYGDTASRYGGDEFVILLPEIDEQESASAVTEKIRSLLAAPYVIDGNILQVTASIGTSLYQNGEQSSGDLIKQADIAMYITKAQKDRSIPPNISKGNRSNVSMLSTVPTILQRILHLNFQGSPYNNQP